MTAQSPEDLREHVLLTVLGTTPRPACYTLEDRRVEAALAPLALVELLDERPDRVLAICTSAAEAASLPLLREGLQDRIPVATVPVPDGLAQEDISVFLGRVVAAVPRSECLDLTVDVTHGFRHFSFLTYIAVLYLSALRGVRIRGAYYGLLNPGGDGPFLDLRPLLDLPRWMHALRVLADTGSAMPMARILEERPSPASRNLARDLARLSESYLAGLPLELGLQARKLRIDGMKPLKRLLEREHRLPLASELVQNLGQLLEPFALEPQTSGEGWKGLIALSTEELERQARVLDDLLDRENTASALGLLNEWTVSWVALHLGFEKGWLDFHGVRRRAGSLLGALRAAGEDAEMRHLLTEEQCALGRFWGTLCELRNSFHHHGMRRQVVVGNEDVARKLQSVTDYWRGTLRKQPDVRVEFQNAPSHRVLISPLGNRPGVLFSALEVCRAAGLEPSLCIVLCSAASEPGIGEACDRAGYSGAVTRLRFEDPYGGRSEIVQFVKEARRFLIGASEVVVNITGGTTLMGLAADELASAARNLASPVRRFGLIDRRSAEDQASDPYRAGEPLWLDGEGFQPV